MILRKSPLKRTSAVIAGALLGLTGIAALATPASAHWPSIKGNPSCVEGGKWKIDWTLSNNYDIDSIVKGVRSSNDVLPAEGVVKGQWLPKRTAVLGSTVLDASVTTETLRVSLKWTDRHVESAETTVTKPGTCVVPEASQSVSPPPPAPEASESVSPAPSSSASESAPASPAPSESESAPASPVPSAPVSPSVSPSAPAPEPTPSYGEAQPIFDVTCDTLTIGLDNPADGVEIPLVLEPSEGDKQTLVVKPGEEKSVTFDTSEGFTVKIYLEGFEDDAETIAWEAPADCETGGTGAGEGDELPLTGAAVGGIATAAVVLLGAGIALFVVARRRKVKFTA